MRAGSILSTARQALDSLRERAKRGPEAKKATDFWSSLPDYHLTNDADPIAIERSEWLANEIVPSLGITSLIEIGTNSGRNLAHIAAKHPDMRLKGIDVNREAIAFAQSKDLPVTFEVADANEWREAADSWDCALTMSVLDHIPDVAAEELARNIAWSCRHVVAVELWDGSPGDRGLYKYSRDHRALFERHGFTTLRWEVAPGQYDEKRSELWVYIGRRAASAPGGAP